MSEANGNSLHSLVGLSGFRVIIADPPWEYRVSHRNGAAAKHYPTMNVDALCAMPVSGVAHEDCALFLWATWPQLIESLRVIEAWGFRYVSGLPWVKTTEPPALDLFGDLRARSAYGTGYWVRGCSEPILIARRGKVDLPLASYAGLLAERMQHSRKPDSLHDVAETLPGPRLELFARRARPGWTVWGNEVEANAGRTFDAPKEVP